MRGVSRFAKQSKQLGASAIEYGLISAYCIGDRCTMTLGGAEAQTRSTRRWLRHLIAPCKARPI
jgi:hypothetical protein